MLADSPGPRRQIQPIRRCGIDGKTIRSVDSPRKSDRLPVFGTVGRTVESAVAGIPDTPVFRTSRQKHIERPVRTAGQSPRKWFRLVDALILQHPGGSAIHALVHSASKAGNVEDARVNGAGRI